MCKSIKPVKKLAQEQRTENKKIEQLHAKDEANSPFSPFTKNSVGKYT